MDIQPAIITFLLIFGVPIGFLVLTFIISLREKQMLWFLEPMQPDPSTIYLTDQPTESTNPYQPTVTAGSSELPISVKAKRCGGELTQLDYQYLGAYRHCKGGIYQLRYDLMLSPDRRVLAMVSCGSLMNLNIEGLTLLSLGNHTDDQRLMCWESITSDNAFSTDYTGRHETMVFQGARATKADALHHRRIASLDVKPFSEDPLNDYFQFRVVNQTEAIDNGWLRLIEEGVALPTLKGAIWTVFSTYKFQLGRRFYPHQWRIKKVA